MRWMGRKGLLLFVTFAGCAGADVYTDKELEHKTGLPFYMAKPYLLVRRSGGTAGGVSVDVIYLPDLEHPLYAAQRVGIGKAKLTVKMTDGKLTEFVADADSKAAEFTGAATAGLKSIAEAIKIQREAEALREEARVMEERRALADELDGLAERTEVTQRTSGELKREAARLKDPALRGNERQVADDLQGKLRALEDADAPEPLRRRLERIIGRLRRIGRLAAGEPGFELYEFRMQDGRTTLVPVALPTGAAPAPSSAG